MHTFSTITVTVTVVFFTETNTNSKMYKEPLMTSDNQSNLEQENWKYHVFLASKSKTIIIKKSQFKYKFGEQWNRNKIPEINPYILVNFPLTKLLRNT